MTRPVGHNQLAIQLILNNQNNEHRRTQRNQEPRASRFHDPLIR
ncbi:hypothetical protein [Rubritalea tangerina]